jgi:hypothetical protein
MGIEWEEVVRRVGEVVQLSASNDGGNWLLQPESPGSGQFFSGERRVKPGVALSQS